MNKDEREQDWRHAQRWWQLMLMLTFSLLMQLTGTSSAAALQERPFPDSRQALVNLIITESIRAGVRPELALAVAQLESGFRAQTVSHTGARGVMQIMPATAWNEFGIDADMLFDPEVNVRIGLQFLSQLIDRYDRTDLALSHYHERSSLILRGRRDIYLTSANHSYAARVIALAREYRYHPQVLAARLDHTPESLREQALDDFDLPDGHFSQAFSRTRRDDSLMKKQHATLKDKPRFNMSRAPCLDRPRGDFPAPLRSSRRSSRVADLHTW